MNFSIKIRIDLNAIRKIKMPTNIKYPSIYLSLMIPLAVIQLDFVENFPLSSIKFFQVFINQKPNKEHWTIGREKIFHLKSTHISKKKVFFTFFFKSKSSIRRGEKKKLKNYSKKYRRRRKKVVISWWNMMDNLIIREERTFLFETLL